jgi:uncharacterized delta-60 repeat protein
MRQSVLVVLILAALGLGRVMPAEAAAANPTDPGFTVSARGEMVVSGMTEVDPFVTGTPNDGFNPGTNGTVFALTTQADGKILVGGSFTTLGGGFTGSSPVSNLGRLNPDGSVDTSFLASTNGTVTAIAVQADGKIVVGGTFNSVGSETTRNNLARFNSDGSLDGAFNPGTTSGFAAGFFQTVTALALQADGKILVAGSFTGIGGGTGTTPASGFARLNTDGSVDTTYFRGSNLVGNNAAGTAVYVSAIAVQPDGRVIIGGEFFGLRRIQKDGTLDPTLSFNLPGGWVSTVGLQADGRIVIGGNFTSLVGGVVRNRLARLYPDGTLDSSFNPGADNNVNTLAVQPDGSILVGGDFVDVGGGSGNTARSHVARLNIDGTVDGAFNPGASDSVNAVVIQGDTKVIFGGAFVMSSNYMRYHIARVYQDGTIDADFLPGAGNFIIALATQTDGKVLVGGAFTTLGGSGGVPQVTRNYIGRLNADGSVDTSFNPGANSYVWSIALQPDGKILVGGDFTTIGGGGTGSTSRAHLARLNSDGSVDTAFNPGANATVFVIFPRPDGSIMVGGSFTALGNGATTTRNRIGRVLSDGSLDTSFNPGANDLVYTISAANVVGAPTTMYLIGGHFTGIGGGTGTTARSHLARIAADGTVDATFNPGADNDVVNLVVGFDGKIIVGGQFQILGGQPRKSIGRLNSDGSLDSTFNPGTNGYVDTVAIQPDGKILIGGGFTGVGGGTGGLTASGNIARLTSSGAVDFTFDPTANNSVYALAVQPDAKILIGGPFTAVNGLARSSLARLSMPESPARTLTVLPQEAYEAWSGPGPTPDRLDSEYSTDGVNYSTYSSGTPLPTNQNIFVRVRAWYSSGYVNGSRSVFTMVQNAYVSCVALTPTVASTNTQTAGVPLSLGLVNATGGLGVITFSASGTLPSGLSFTGTSATSAPATIGVTGSTTQTGSYPLTVTASDSYSQCVTSQAVTLTIAAPMTTVPNVVGATQTAATSAITAANLTVGAITTAASTTVPSGAVISETPAAGTSVPLGSAVALTVSSGPAQVTVPNVVGDTQAAATSAITAAHLTVGAITTATSTTVPSGSVMSQTPAAGTSVAAGSAVALTVAGCGYTAGPPTRNIGAGSGADTGVMMTTASGCAWNASADAAWVHVAGGTGSGSVPYTYDANPTTSARSAHLIVAGTTILVVQPPQTSSVSVSAPSAVLSGDGRYLAYATSAAVAATDTNGVSDIYVLDRVNPTAAPVRISVSSAGDQANGASSAPAISGDGRYVVFSSVATNLVSTPTGGVLQVFVRDRDTDGNGIFDEPGGVATLLISKSAFGAAGTAASLSPAITADGQTIAFASDANNLVLGDTNGVRDVFVSTRHAAAFAISASLSSYTLARGSVALGGAQTDGDSDHPSLSSHYLAFDSAATNLVSGDTNGVRDVFVVDLTTGTTTRASLNADGTQATAESDSPAVADTGLVVFTSAAALVAGDTNGVTDIYSHPLGGATVRESVGNDGSPANGASAQAVVSADGGLVAFMSSASNLSNLAPNGTANIYLRDRGLGLLTLASLPAPDGVPRSYSDPALSRNGAALAFSTALIGSSLVAADATGSSGAGVSVTALLPPSLSLEPSSGPAGTPVTISGANLAGANLAGATVFFDRSIQADTVPSAATTVVATAPAHGDGAVPVTVSFTGPVGNIVLPAGTFTYQTVPDCTLTLSGVGGAPVSPAGGSVNATVGTGPSCGWLASTDAPSWISIGPAQAQGTGTVTATVAANSTPATRVGNLIVNGQPLAISQTGSGCSVPQGRVRDAYPQLPPDAADQGGRADIQVTIEPGCPWSAVTTVPWITLQDGHGPGALDYAVGQNTATSIRQGEIDLLAVYHDPSSGQPPAVLGVPPILHVTQQGALPPPTCTYTVTPSSLNISSAATSVPLTVTTPAGCPWSPSVDVPWMTVSTSGPVTAVLTIQANGSGPRQGSVHIEGVIVPVTQPGVLGAVPFGVVDTPTVATAATPVSGSIPLTGWALYAHPNLRVRIYRELVAGETGGAGCPGGVLGSSVTGALCVYVGDATFVPGARPDVQQAYPSLPNSNQAGWGYLLLTNGLGADGVYALRFYAEDCPTTSDPANPTPCTTNPAVFPAGFVLLDRRQVLVSNATAVQPFGAIDTPGQGSTVSGTALNFGWVLAPPPAHASPVDGGTVVVNVDGQALGAPVAWTARPDITASFGAGHPDVVHAVGVFALDTTLFSDGVHTINWTLTDTAGQPAGIGSRFFTVENLTPALRAASSASLVAASGSLAVSSASLTLQTIPTGPTAVGVTRGASEAPTMLGADARGVRHVVVRALDTVTLTFGTADGAALEGYRLQGDRFAALPIGSTLTPTTETFTWQLGPGFAGIYDLVFLRGSGDARERIPVRLVVEPHASAHLDALTVGAPVRTESGALMVIGTVLAGDARQLRDLRVYAVPQAGGAEQLVGETAVAGVAPGPYGSFGGHFAPVAFRVPLAALPPGTYDLRIEARSALAPDLDATVWIRGVTVGQQ